MYFNNPDIIKNDTDVVLGSLYTDKEELSYLEIMYLSKIRIAMYIREDVRELMGNGLSHDKAMEIVRGKVYRVLDMFEKRLVYDEDELAEVIVELSRNYDSWSTEILSRFFDTHAGKVKRDTPIKVYSEEAKYSEEDIESILENTGLDYILERLAMVLDIGDSKVS